MTDIKVEYSAPVPIAAQTRNESTVMPTSLSGSGLSVQKEPPVKERRPRTVEETIALAALGCVTFPPASWDKRFFRTLSSVQGITDKEAPQLWRLFQRYRRQIDCPRKDELLGMAEKLAAPDFRKQAAEQRRLVEIQEKYNAAMKAKGVQS